MFQGFSTYRKTVSNGAGLLLMERICSMGSILFTFIVAPIRIDKHLKGIKMNIILGHYVSPFNRHNLMLQILSGLYYPLAVLCTSSTQRLTSALMYTLILT